MKSAREDNDYTVSTVERLDGAKMSMQVKHQMVFEGERKGVPDR